MRKFVLLIVFALISSNIIFLPVKSFAATSAKCEISEITPDNPVKSGTSAINLKIQTGGDLPNEYWIVFDNGKNSTPIYDASKNPGMPAEPVKFKPDAQGIIEVKNLYSNGWLNWRADIKLESKSKYTVNITSPESQGFKWCKTPMAIPMTQEVSASGDCTILVERAKTNPDENPDEIIEPFTNLTPYTSIVVRVLNLKPITKDWQMFWENSEPPQQRLVFKIGDKRVYDSCPSNLDLVESGKPGGTPIYTGQHELGTYTVELRDHCNPGEFGERAMCNTPSFEITRNGKTNVVPSDVCNKREKPKEGEKLGRCLEVNTGLGIPIATTPDGFIKSIFGIILGLAGGVAILLTIVSGYRLMTSQGNPEKVQGAKETLTSAIIGLVFIIFSFAILQIIGEQILRIPGFKP